MFQIGNFFVINLLQISVAKNKEADHTDQPPGQTNALKLNMIPEDHTLLEWLLIICILRIKITPSARPVSGSKCTLVSHRTEECIS